MDEIGLIDFTEEYSAGFKTGFRKGKISGINMMRDEIYKELGKADDPVSKEWLCSYIESCAAALKEGLIGEKYDN